MSNIPIRLTKKEVRELASCSEVQALWAVESPAEMEERLSEIYVVKFKFINGSPGYRGDLYLIQPDYLAEDLPVVRLIRDEAGRLVVVPKKLNILLN